MTVDHEPKIRCLTIGEETKNIKPGVKIIVTDEKIFTVKKVEENGQLNVRVKELETGQTYTALMVKGTPIIIQESE